MCSIHVGIISFKVLIFVKKNKQNVCDLTYTNEVKIIKLFVSSLFYFNAISNLTSFREFSQCMLMQ